MLSGCPSDCPSKSPEHDISGSPRGNFITSGKTVPLDWRMIFNPDSKIYVPDMNQKKSLIEFKKWCDDTWYSTGVRVKRSGVTSQSSAKNMFLTTGHQNAGAESDVLTMSDIWLDTEVVTSPPLTLQNVMKLSISPQHSTQNSFWVKTLLLELPNCQKLH